jgi:BirA family transcriptional regulator, biotin operon repressor / biotin---[acetyl-CoA-carboxylase] ligase
MSQIFKKHKILKLKEVDSTNIFTSKESVQLDEGTIVWAEFQNKGKGLGENFWESDRGENLTYSILLRPLFLKAAQQFYLSKTISLAVADLISLYLKDVSIKWPNDIYVGNKKISGILIENSVERDYIKESIIGIGININQKYFKSDAPNPVSLSQLTGENYILKDVIDIFLNIFDYRYQMLLDNEIETINSNYSELLYLKGVRSEFKSEKGSFYGIIKGVEETGDLIIQDDSGHIHKFLYKEVEFVI